MYECTIPNTPLHHITRQLLTICASDITLIQGPSCAIVNICMLKNKNPFIILRKRQFYAQEVKFSPIPGTVTCDDGRDDLKTWSLCCIIAPSHHSVTTAFRIQLLLKFEDASVEMGFRMTFHYTFTWRKEHQVCGIERTPAQKRQQAQMPSLTLGGFRSPYGAGFGRSAKTLRRTYI